MEPWWFLEPLLYTGFVISAIGVVIGYIIHKLTDGISDAPFVIVLVAAIPMIIATLLWVIWGILWIFYQIWSPFL